MLNSYSLNVTSLLLNPPTSVLGMSLSGKPSLSAESIIWPLLSKFL